MQTDRLTACTFFAFGTKFDLAVKLAKVNPGPLFMRTL